MSDRYLHEVCMPCVVHKNFKSSNILLDEELNPHLSDCGLAALTPNTQREVNWWTPHHTFLFSTFSYKRRVNVIKYQTNYAKLFKPYHSLSNSVTIK